MHSGPSVHWLIIVPLSGYPSHWTAVGTAQKFREVLEVLRTLVKT